MGECYTFRFLNGYKTVEIVQEDDVHYKKAPPCKFYRLTRDMSEKERAKLLSNSGFQLGDGTFIKLEAASVMVIPNGEGFQASKAFAFTVEENDDDHMESIYESVVQFVYNMKTYNLHAPREPQVTFHYGLTFTKSNRRVVFFNMQCQNMTNKFSQERQAEVEIFCICAILTINGQEAERKTFSITHVTCEEERKILTQWYEWCCNVKPHCMVAYNGNNFDFPCLLERCKKYAIYFDPWLTTKTNLQLREKFGLRHCYIPGVHLIDPMVTLKKDLSIQRDSYSLSYMAGEIGMEKMDLDVDDMCQHWSERHEAVKQYCMHNVETVKAIVEHNRVFDGLDEDTVITGSFDLQSLNETRSAHYNATMMSRRQIELEQGEGKIFVMCDIKARKTVKYKGGNVETPIVGMYENVRGVDYVSLYPSVAQIGNLGPWSSLGTYMEERRRVYPTLENQIKSYCDGFVELNRELKGNSRHKLEAIIRRTLNLDEDEGVEPKTAVDLVRHCFSISDRDPMCWCQMNAVRKKSEAKNELKSAIKESAPLSTQLVLEAKKDTYKRVANSIYGTSGATCFYYQSIETAAATADLGRIAKRMARTYLVKHGFHIVYGDTDSIYFQRPDRQAHNECKEGCEDPYCPVRVRCEMEQYVQSMLQDVIDKDFRICLPFEDLPDGLYRYVLLSNKKKTYIRIHDKGIDMKNLPRRHSPCISCTITAKALRCDACCSAPVPPCQPCLTSWACHYRCSPAEVSHRHTEGKKKCPDVCGTNGHEPPPRKMVKASCPVWAKETLLRLVEFISQTALEGSSIDREGVISFLDTMLQTRIADFSRLKECIEDFIIIEKMPNKQRKCAAWKVGSKLGITADEPVEYVKGDRKRKRHVGCGQPLKSGKLPRRCLDESKSCYTDKFELSMEQCALSVEEWRNFDQSLDMNDYLQAALTRLRDVCASLGLTRGDWCCIVSNVERYLNIPPITNVGPVDERVILTVIGEKPKLFEQLKTSHDHVVEYEGPSGKPLSDFVAQQPHIPRLAIMMRGVTKPRKLAFLSPNDGPLIRTFTFLFCKL